MQKDTMPEVAAGNAVPPCSTVGMNGPVLVFGGNTPSGDDIEICSMFLEYDASSAARKMRDRGLPQGYAETLESGLWPSSDVLPATELTRRGDAIAPDRLLWSIG